MLLAHGTTERNADLIEERGLFIPKTYFLKLSPDPKIALFGVSGFALRQHPKTPGYIDLYCKQDIILRPFKKGLEKIADGYISKKKDDNTPGLIYVIDVPENVLDYHKGMRSLFIPTEVFSTEWIPTSTIDHIVTLEENATYFENKYGHETKILEDINYDFLMKRIFYSFFIRFNRIICGKK